MRDSNGLLQVDVPPLDGRRECVGLLMALVVIFLLMALRVSLIPAQSTSLFLKPYHQLDTTLSEQERIIYQTLKASQAEIVALWQEAQQAEQKWPTVAMLSEEGVPPFAQDMMPVGMDHYAWKTIDRGPWVDYLGHSEAGPSFLLRIIDLHADFHPHPHPGKDYDPNQQTALQIWLHPLSQQRYAGMQLIERGWSWVLSEDDPILLGPTTVDINK